MKKAFIVLIISTHGLIAVGAQNVKESEVPSAVTAAFNKKYPDTNPKWEKEKDTFKVNFRKDGKTMSAVIDKAGEIIKTETDIAVNELPGNALSYLKVHYEDAKEKEAVKIVKANNEVNYEGEVKGKDVIFDKNGKFIKIARD